MVHWGLFWHGSESPNDTLWRCGCIEKLVFIVWHHRVSYTVLSHWIAGFVMFPRFFRGVAGCWYATVAYRCSLSHWPMWRPHAIFHWHIVSQNAPGLSNSCWKREYRSPDYNLPSGAMYAPRTLHHPLALWAKLASLSLSITSSHILKWLTHNAEPQVARSQEKKKKSLTKVMWDNEGICVFICLFVCFVAHLFVAFHWGEFGKEALWVALLSFSLGGKTDFSSMCGSWGLGKVFALLLPGNLE